MIFTNLTTVLQALRSAEGQNFSVVSDEKLRQVKTLPFYAPQLQRLREKAAAMTQEDIPTIRYSHFKLFDETGSRTEFQRTYMYRREMLITFFLSALFDGKNIDQLEDILWAICDEFSWCLPAHFGYGGTHIPQAMNEKDDGTGKIKAALRPQPEVIDLCNAATAGTLAEIVSLLEEKLAPGVVYRVRKEVTARVLLPFMQVNTPFGWETCTNNWGAVCAGNIGLAAMYTIDDSNVLAPILTRCCQTMDCYLSGFEADGVCTEGLGYWAYGLSSFIMFADLLRRRTGGKIDLFDSDKVRAVALFQQQAFLNGSAIIPFSDCGSSASYYYMTTHYLKHLFPEVTVPDTGKTPDMLTCREYPTIVLREFMWSDPTFTPTGAPAGETVFADSQWLVSRVHTADAKIAFAIKGGHNEESHNHNDIGSFVLNLDGETLVGDLGGGLYNKEYFSARRYDFLVNGSQGHPVPLVNGQTQKAGRSFAAKDFAAFGSSEAAVYKADLAPAYGMESLQSLLRTATLQKADGTLQISDAFAFAGGVLPVKERFVTKFPAQLSGGDVLIRGKKHALRLHGEGLQWKISTDSYVHSADEAPVTVWLLDAEIASPAEVTVTFTPEAVN